MSGSVVRRLALLLVGSLACCVVGAVALAVLAVTAAVAITLLALDRAARVVSLLRLVLTRLRRRIATSSGAP